MAIKVQVRDEELKKVGNAMLRAQIARRLVQNGIDQFLPVMKQEAPKRTSKLEGSILGRIEESGDGLRGVVGPSKEGWYARFVAFGTKPHEIFPKRFRSKRGQIKPKTRTFQTPDGRVTTRVRGGFMAVRFVGRAGETFRRFVRHRGGRANPFPERAVGRGLGPLATRNEQVIQQVLDGRAP